MRKSAYVLFAVGLVLAGAASASCLPVSPSLVPSDQTCWTEEDPGNVGTYTVLPDGFSFINATLGTSSSSQWQYNAAKLVVGKTYTTSFSVSGLPSGQMFVLTAQKKSDPWNTYGLWLVIDHNGPYYASFTSSASDDSARIAFQTGSATTATVTNFDLDDPSQCADVNGLTNGDFDCGLVVPPNGWKPLVGSLASGATLSLVSGYSGNALQVTLPSFMPGVRNAWDVQFGQLVGTQFVQNQYFRLSGRIKGSAIDSIIVEINNPTDGYSAVGLYDTLTFSPTWSQFQTDFWAHQTTSTAQLAFDLALAQAGVHVQLDELTLTPITITGVGPPRQSGQKFSVTRHSDGWQIQAASSCPGTVAASFYDVKGKRVSAISTFAQAGATTLRWDGNVPSGVYFIRLTVPDATYHGKLVIIH